MRYFIAIGERDNKEFFALAGSSLAVRLNEMGVELLVALISDSVADRTR